MNKVSAQATIKDGKLILRNRQIFAEELKSLLGDVILTVAEGRETRSNQQNKYLWGCVYKTLAQSEIGYTEEEWHEMCKYKYLRKHYVVGDEEIDVGSTTTKLTTIEFEEYVENIRRWGATLGVNILLPNEPQREPDKLDEFFESLARV